MSQETKPTPLRRRASSLWFRIAVVWVLIGLISFAMVWWPRRACWALLWRGGHLQANGNGLALDFANKLPPFCAPLRLFITNHQSWFLVDHEVSFVSLLSNGTGDGWVSSAKLLPKLTSIGVPARSISSRLEELESLEQLQYLRIDGADAKTRLSPLQSLRGVRQLALWSSSDAPADLAQLREHPGLKLLFLENPEQPAVMLERLTGCENIEEIDIRHPHKPAADFLPHLIPWSRLKRLKLACPLTDGDLDIISRVSSLEVLELYFSDEPSPITLDGWRKLEQHPNLKALTFSDDSRHPAFSADDAAQVPLILKRCQVKRGTYNTMRMIPRP